MAGVPSIYGKDIPQTAAVLRSLQQQINSGVPGPPGPAGPAGPPGTPGTTYQSGPGLQIIATTTPPTIDVATPYLALTGGTLSGLLTLSNGLTVTAGVVKQNVLTVATLPAAGTNNGARAQVSDANATTFYSIVAAGGSNHVPVFCDGTNWRIG